MQEWIEYDEIEEGQENRSNNDIGVPIQKANAMAQNEGIRIYVASELQMAGIGAGLGVVLRDAQNSTIVAKAESCNIIQESCIVEMEAVRRSLDDALHRRFQDVEIRLDVKAMVAWL